MLALAKAAAMMQGCCGWLLTNLKLQSVTFFVFKMYKIYIIREYTMNPFSKPCFWLVLNRYGTPIISVYIRTIFRLVRVSTAAE